MISVYVLGRDFLDSSDSNKFLEKYVWLLTYVIVVAMNSLLNPVVYYTRMTRFRLSVGRDVRRSVRRLTREESGEVVRNRYAV